MNASNSGAGYTITVSDGVNAVQLVLTDYGLSDPQFGGPVPLGEQVVAMINSLANKTRKVRV